MGGECVEIVLGVCGECLKNVWEVCGKWVGSAPGLCGKCLGNVWEVLVEVVSEVVGDPELSANTCKTPCKDVLRKCARALKLRHRVSNSGESRVS